MVLGVGFEPTLCLCDGFTVRLLRPLVYPSTGGQREIRTLSQTCLGRPRLPLRQPTICRSCKIYEFPYEPASSATCASCPKSTSYSLELLDEHEYCDCN